MHSDELERRLRLPAPDEPSVLPALILPTLANDTGRVQGRVRMSSTFGSGRSSIPVVAVVGLLLVAMVGLLVTGAIRLDHLPNPFDELNDFRGSGVHIAYPDDWHELVTKEIEYDIQVGETEGEHSTLALVSNVELAGCAIDDVKCFTSLTLPPGAIRVRLLGSVREAVHDPGVVRAHLDITDALPEDGWTFHIDGMPARLDVDAQPSGGPADEIRRWSVIQPGNIFLVWVVEAALRGPDLDGLRAQADAIANSMTFDARPMPLDDADKGNVLRRTLDDADREARLSSFSKFYACFPRTAGARKATISEGPYLLLPTPVPVTCASEISATAVHFWRITLTVSWDAGDGYAVGRWVQELWADANGQLGGQVGDSGWSSLPEAPRVSPPPLAGPFDLPVGSLVEILTPGMALRATLDPPDPSNKPSSAVFDPRPMIGRHVYILAGPVMLDGDEWYQVQWRTEVGWIRGTLDGRPMLRIVEPICPSTADLNVPNLLDLTGAERVLCFGNDDLALGPVTVTLAENLDPWWSCSYRCGRDDGPRVNGTPEWLAEESRWQLWGSDGTEGIDGAIRVSIDPSLGTTLPTGAWLTIHGHFDDPASGSCQRTWVHQDPNLGAVDEPESPELQVLRCREHFVITSFERVAP